MNFQRLLEIPQILYIMLNVLVIIGALVMHGRPFKVRVWVFAIYYLIVYALLHWGGFFS